MDRNRVELLRHCSDANYDARLSTQSDVSVISSLNIRPPKSRKTSEVFIAFEVSKTVDANDVRRAAERAALIRRAGLDAEAFAGGQLVTPQAAALAAELGVQLVLDRSSSPSA